MAAYAPKPRLSSIIDNWAPHYIARTQAVLDGDLDRFIEASLKSGL